MHELFSVLQQSAHAFPDRHAIEAPSRPPLTYRILFQTTSNLAQSLRSTGLGRQDRIAVVLPNGPEMAVAFLATACASVSAPLNPAYSVDEFAFYMQDLEAKALLTRDGCSPAAIQAAQKLGIPVHLITFQSSDPAGAFQFAHPSTPTLAPEVKPDDIALVLHTSGTTSRPKLVPLTHANLTASAESIAQGLQLRAHDRCLNVMPLFHVHGLIGALLSSLRAGACTLCTPGFKAESFGGWMQAHQPTWYTAVPTMHQAILARPHDEFGPAAPTLRFIRSCSAALPPSIMQQLEQRFGVPVIEAYGMTEASHQMASNPLPPAVRKPGSVGQSTLAEVTILDEKGNQVPAGSSGEVAIRGTNVTRGYENNPSANAQSWTHGWFRTGDMGHLDHDGYLFLTGRLKEIINRGGEKISPREVDEVLLEHPAVAQAVAFGRTHPSLGEDVCAAVVLKPGQTTTERALRDFAIQRLADFKVPSTILVLDQIPKGPTGKVQRVGLASKLTAHFKAEHVAPRNLLESLVLEIWSEVLGHSELGVRDNFFGSGGDSLKAGRILARVEETFEVKVARTLLFQRPTVELLSEHLQTQISPDHLRNLEQLVQEVLSSDPGPK